ncbi:8270_t:CDS:2, partial [Ambispora leptoticha]
MPEKKCISCAKLSVPLEKGQLRSLLTDGGTVFSSVNHRPNSKHHTDSIAKIEAYLKKANKPIPVGYRISIPNGELAAQNMPPHFYMRVVPKYKKDFGSVMQDKVIAENNKLIAKLCDDNGKEMPTFTRESL